MMLALATLAAYLQLCAPSIAPDTMRAIISVESRGYIYAINDNAAHATYCVPGTPVFPCNDGQAATLAERAVRSGHSVDVGIAQVNSSNFRTYGVSTTQMLDPCENLRIGSKILVSAYLQSTARFADERAALWHAIMAYNSGSLYAGENYVRSVLNMAAPIRVNPTVPSIRVLSTAQSPAALSRFRQYENERTRASKMRRIPLSPNAAPLSAPLLATTRRGDLTDSLEPARLDR